MSSGYCDKCGDASGERHLCVPPFLDRGSLTSNASRPFDQGFVTFSASTPPPLLTHETRAAHIARLEAENAQLHQALTRTQVWLSESQAETARLQRQRTGAEADRHALYEEVCRLRAGLESLRQAHQAEDQDYSVFCPRAKGGAICWCGAAEHNARIDALLDGPTSVDPPSPLTAEIVRLRAILARYADVLGDDARDVLPGVPF